MPKVLQTREWEYERFKNFSSDARYILPFLYFFQMLRTEYWESLSNVLKIIAILCRY